MKAPAKAIVKYLTALLIIGNCGYLQAQTPDALDSIKKEIATATTIDTNHVKSIFRVANGFMNINADSARYYADKGMPLAKKLNFKKAIAAFYNLYGSLYSDKGEYQKAINYFNLSYSINKAIDNKNNQASNYSNIGSAYQRQGNFLKSQEYNFKALKLAEGVKSYYLAGTITNNIANVYTAQKDFAKALSYSNYAIKTQEKLGDINGMASSYINIGNIYLLQNHLKQAETYYNRALKYYKDAGNQIGEASSLSLMAQLYDKTDKDTKLSYLLKAQVIFDEVEPKFPTSITNLGNIGGTYAEIYINNNLPTNKTYHNIPKSRTILAQKAAAYLNRAITYSKEVGDVDNLSYFSGDLARLQEKNGDFKGAFYNTRLSRTIDDSLYSQQSKNKLASLDAEYKFQKKEDNYKQQQQVAKFKMRQIILYAALAITLVTSVLIYLLNLSRIRELRLKNELQRKQAEEQARELMHRNKLSESELKAIRSQMNPHFIFNVLNSIESYVLENDSKTASRLVQKFATLSRLILENSTQSMVAAEREWKALRLYTELEAMRFNNQFSYSFYADPDLDLATLMLPPMLVQPLIENSIHHGLRNSAAGKSSVAVKLEQGDAVIFFTIDDTGIGMDEAEKFKTSSTIKSKSIGLNAIRERVEIINEMANSNKAAFTIRKKTKEEGPGTVAILTLPKVIRNTFIP